MASALETDTADLRSSGAEKRPVLQATSRTTHAETILGHIDAAKARKSGTDLSGMTDDELIADLLAHRVGV